MNSLQQTAGHFQTKTRGDSNSIPSRIPPLDILGSLLRRSAAALKYYSVSLTLLCLRYCCSPIEAVIVVEVHKKLEFTIMSCRLGKRFPICLEIPIIFVQVNCSTITSERHLKLFRIQLLLVG